MIAQKYRFHGHNSLRYVFANGQMARDKFFAVKWAPNERRHHPRLSVVVSKKIFKSAVKRNRVRRRIYEIARPLLIDAPAIDVVISVHVAEVLDASRDELAIQLLPLLHGAGLKSRAIHE
jgi:ribonuclease P protein component